MPEDAKSVRRQRLAEALRANLKRRKAAQEGKAETKPVAADDAQDGGSAETGGTKRD